MKIGPLTFGWSPLSREEARQTGLDTTLRWEVLCVEWNGTGFALLARPCKGTVQQDCTSAPMSRATEHRGSTSPG